MIMQDELLAEQLQQAADRAQKWKSRCARLRQELMETQTSAASLEAALNVRCCCLLDVMAFQNTRHAVMMQLCIAGGAIASGVLLQTKLSMHITMAYMYVVTAQLAGSNRCHAHLDCCHRMLALLNTSLWLSLIASRRRN